MAKVISRALDMLHALSSRGKKEILIEVTGNPYIDDLHRYYNGKLTLKEALLHITYMMASPRNFCEDNVAYVKVLRAAIDSEEWASIAECPEEYKYTDRLCQVDQIFDVLKLIENEVEARKQMEHFPVFIASGMKAWELGNGDVRRSAILRDPDSYTPQFLSMIKEREAHVNAVLENGMTPEAALDLIIYNWQFLYNYTSTYEAVAYIISHCHMRNTNVWIALLEETLTNLRA